MGKPLVTECARNWIAAIYDSSAPCSSGLRGSTFSDFILRRLHPRWRYPAAVRQFAYRVDQGGSTAQQCCVGAATICMEARALGCIHGSPLFGIRNKNGEVEQ